MQKINVNLNHDNFYCPVTGIQILSAEEFNPSPALKIWYNDGFIEYLAEDFKLFLSEQGIDTSMEPLEVEYDDFENVTTKFNSNEYVLFAITRSGIACGPVSTTTFFLIDMNFDR